MHSHIYDQLPRVLPSRRNLGTIVYNPTTTWETLQIKQLHGLRKQDLDMLVRMQSEYMERKNNSAGEMNTVYIPVIPHLSDAYINCFLEVKIPYVHIKDFLKSHSQGQVERKRELWGGYAGIYTDDSDLLYVLCHLGLFNNSLDLTECNAEWVPSDVTRPATVHRDQDGIELLDLSVTLLLLPSLNAYKGFYRNRLNSRSWQSSAAVHSGLSIAVHNVKWETFLLSTADRALNKRAVSEYIDDRNASTQILEQKNGWKLDLLLRKSKHDVKAQAPGAS
ncbi:Rxt3-domain-containing protein [Metschnikowia bicuspidata var. bicuspidata NRRL YB-4993]|uniref:Rxt3-domain-containing protein n=1 Tax=Metschnikowia bicuspidata var. bicuspidata NRRL YB-4993 TaxID=869754 RepID=A0A1A0HF56_9ASCO|nr:Rxt3-domain-containing protein [Metschnikowia bicuspidata var. bicuspidata NRRL YB-4993]OBA22518.1 Rxt3-domain-containing protein [Metschnikowia bicuspidata var. bicuspidata NRRL YB-4993]